MLRILLGGRHIEEHQSPCTSCRKTAESREPEVSFRRTFGFLGNDTDLDYSYRPVFKNRETEGGKEEGDGLLLVHMPSYFHKIAHLCYVGGPNPLT